MAKIVNASGQFVKFRKDGFVVGLNAMTSADKPSVEKSLGMRMTPEDWKTFGKWFAKNKKSLTKKPKAPKAFKLKAPKAFELKTNKGVQLDGVKVENGVVAGVVDKPTSVQ